MRILVIGGNGTIGRKVVHRLKENHDVLIAGRTGGDVIVDITSSESISQMFKQIGKLDAIVCIAGEAKWDDFKQISEDDYYIGLRSKLMGQVNLVRIGQDYLTANGSITLSSGILADKPVIKTASAAMVNGGIHSFVKAVALEMENGIRVNVVSSGLVEDAYERYKDYFVGHSPVPMNKVIDGYVQGINGEVNGEVIRIYN